MAVQGIKELKAQLIGIKRAVRNASRTAAYAGAVEIRQALRQAAPTRNAVARRSIAANRKQSPRQGTGIAQVGLKGPAFYLAILSSGAKGHEIVARSVTRVIDPKTRKVIGKQTRKRLVLVGSVRPGGKSTGKFFGPKVRHPGLRGRNWIMPVIDSARTRALDAIGKEYAQAMTAFASNF